MWLHRVRQASVAAGRRNGNISRLPLPEPILVAAVTTMAWEATSKGHDVDLAGWERKPVNGNPDRPAVVLHLVEESEASKMGEFNETVILGNAAQVRALFRLRAQRLPRSRLDVPEVFWQTFHRAIAFLAVETALGKKVPYVQRHAGATADAWAQRRSLTEKYRPEADGKPRDQCDAAPKVVASPTR